MSRQYLFIPGTAILLGMPFLLQRRFRPHRRTRRIIRPRYGIGSQIILIRQCGYLDELPMLLGGFLVMDEGFR